MDTAGYRTETPYPARFQKELNPRRFALALAAQGLAAPDMDAPFTYMDLGCGMGVPLVCLAAGNPHARFYGVDFMAEHVAHARGLADAAALNNLDVRAASFADLAPGDFPMFDVMVVHGVWSWVTPDVRAQLLAFIDARLKPGGLLYVSYNAMPGWAAMIPLREIMKQAFDRAGGDQAARVAAAMAHARALEGAQTLYLRAHPTNAIRLKQMATESPAYLAHEYFNEAWRPCYVREVAADVAGVGLTFAASANLQDNVTDLTVRAEARALFEGATTALERETLKDMLLCKQFRRDIFVRGPSPLSDGEMAAVHARVRFGALMTPAQLAEATLTTEIMTVKLNTEVHRGLVGALIDAPRTLAEAIRHPAVSGLNANAAFGTFYLLAAMGAVAPAASDAVMAAASEPVARLNAEIARRAGTPNAIPARAVAMVGGGVAAN
ncbi:MAG: class I SAM-dependent methyltransferase [Rhodospirillaceae bacterium]|nr:class I SAM-dependent methyltransferase [Rhodospirillaceae bacterium]